MSERILTNRELAELEAAYAAATPGEWDVIDRTVYSLDTMPGMYRDGKPLRCNRLTVSTYTDNRMAKVGEDEASAMFISTSHNKHPAFLARLKRAEEGWQAAVDHIAGGRPMDDDERRKQIDAFSAYFAEVEREDADHPA